jgi:hypothetical protein
MKSDERADRVSEPSPNGRLRDSLNSCLCAPKMKPKTARATVCTAWPSASAAARHCCALDIVSSAPSRTALVRDTNFPTIIIIIIILPT